MSECLDNCLFQIEAAMNPKGAEVEENIVKRSVCASDCLLLLLADCPFPRAAYSTARLTNL